MLISIIVPTHNSEKTIENLIQSILEQDDYCLNKNVYEIIMVDDYSQDRTIEIIRKYSDISLFAFQSQQGPAAARNKGAELARGDILFFLDADTALEPNCLKEVKQTFVDHSHIRCVNGICSPESLNKGIFPQYKAFVEYSWTMPIANLSNNHTCFNARVGAVYKSVFIETGGFNTVYKGAQVEDYEFGYRLINKYKIYYNKKIQIRHNFPGFKTTTLNYIDRIDAWFKLFFKRKQFDTAGTSMGSALGYVGGFFMIASGFLFFFSKVLAIIAVSIGLLAFIYYNRYFLKLLLRQRNLIIFLINFLIHLYFSLVISLAAFWALFRFGLLGRIKQKATLP